MISEHSLLGNSRVTKIVSSSAKSASDEMKLQDLIYQHTFEQLIQKNYEDCFCHSAKTRGPAFAAMVLLIFIQLSGKRIL